MVSLPKLRLSGMKQMLSFSLLFFGSLAMYAQAGSGAGSSTGTPGGAVQSGSGAGAGTAPGTVGGAAKGAAQSAAGAAQGAAGTAAGAAGAATGLTNQDKQFATMVAQTDLAEIQVGNLALQKSTSDDVKKIAQKLVDDHTKTSTELKQIASSKNMTLPTEPDAKHQALATKLQNDSPDKFDQDFIKANSADHHKVVGAFQKESEKGQDPEIKAFATKFLPSIQEHTQMIDQAKSSSK